MTDSSPWNCSKMPTLRPPEFCQAARILARPLPWDIKDNRSSPPVMMPKRSPADL